MRAVRVSLARLFYSEKRPVVFLPTTYTQGGTTQMEAHMRALMAPVILCASVCTGYAAESTRHAFSSATEDKCIVRQVWEDAGTKLVSVVELACMDGDVEYLRKLEVGNAEANWPTLEWNNSKRGDPVVCKLAHVRFGKGFWVVKRAFRECMLLPSADVKARKK